MSLQPQAIPPVPETTARTAHAAFPRGNRSMVIRDELGTLYTDHDFATLFSSRGQPAEAPGRLALILVFQFAESLSDEQALEALRARIDWKYALSLGLDDPGFDPSVLSEFRDRLIAGSLELHLLDAMLAYVKSPGLLKARGRQRSDSTHVLAAVRALNRLQIVGETPRQWTGYKVHLTESCDEEGPHCITHVHTSVAPGPNYDALDPIHEALAARELLPAEHLVDAGYPDAAALVSSQQQDIDRWDQ